MFTLLPEARMPQRFDLQAAADQAAAFFVRQWGAEAMSKRLQILQAVCQLVADALPSADVLGIDNDAVAPTRMPRRGPRCGAQRRPG
jgi:hypothetical protein